MAAGEARTELQHVEPTGPDDLAGWLFTSGSTGSPRPASTSSATSPTPPRPTRSGSLATARTTSASRSPSSSSGTRRDEPDVPLRVGAIVVLFEARHADEVLDQIEAHRPSFLTGVPTLFNNVLRSARPSTPTSPTCGSRSPRVRRCRRRCTRVEGSHRRGDPGRHRLGGDVPHISNRPDDVVPGALGTLVPGYEAEIVDPSGRPVGVDEPGRLRIAEVRPRSAGRQGQVERDVPGRGARPRTCSARTRTGSSGTWVAATTCSRSAASGSALEIENALLDHDAVHGAACSGARTRPDS